MTYFISHISGRSGVTAARSRLDLTVILSALLLLTVLRPAGPYAQNLTPIENRESIQLPADLNRVSFYLITVDVGDQIWDNFGHTALRVIDESSNTDLLFNWGLFDTSGGNLAFAAKFARGIMDYQLGVAPPGWELGRYRQEERTVWQDRINLTTQQKARLYQRLAWNLRDENIVYDYNYFYDNCTTRVRDYLNEALQGSLASATQHPVARSFRDEVLGHYASVPVVSLSLDVLMNSRVDQRMSQWEQMFLPAQLRARLLERPSSVFANGERLNLLSDSQILMQFSPPPAGMNPYYFLAGLLLPVLGFLLLNVRRIPLSSFSSSPGFTFLNAGLSFRLLGLAGLLVGLGAAIYGSMLLFGWLVSGHLVLHHNVNLLLFWPTDIVFAVFALRWLIAGTAVSLKSGRYQLLNFYLLAHLLAALAYLVIALADLVEQDIDTVAIFILPSLLLFILLVWTAGLRLVRSIRFG